MFDRAGNNDIVHVAAGTYAESTIGIEYNLTIEGATDGTTTISDDGEGIFGVFGSTTENGAFAPTVTFKNLNISGNGEGEGILAETADVHIIDSHVDDNAAGGVIAANATVEASNSTFNGNVDPEAETFPFAAGLLILQGAATVDHSTFDGNHGGGIILFPIDIIIGGEVSNVRANAANNEPGSVALDHSTVSNNDFGGVLGLESSIQVTTSTLSGNTGAGIDNAGGVADVENSTITGTKAEPVSNDRAAADVFGAGVVTQTEEAGFVPSTKTLRAAAPGSRSSRRSPSRRPRRGSRSASRPLRSRPTSTTARRRSPARSLPTRTAFRTARATTRSRSSTRATTTRATRTTAAGSRRPITT